DELTSIAGEILPFMDQVWRVLEEKRKAGARILFEGAQGALLDNDHGTYPDRKSTRLNSSHVKISYAVFCLKKKKTRNCARGSSFASIRISLIECLSELSSLLHLLAPLTWLISTCSGRQIVICFPSVCPILS